MSGKKCTRCRLITLSITCGLTSCLFFISFFVDYQNEMVREHVRFRSGYLSQANWIDSPFGTLKWYLFNVTNSEAFLNGTDSKIKLQEVGPIVYRIKGRNQVLEQTDSTLTYQKIRNNEIEFDPVASVSPDILNQTITLPNLLLLGAASKLHDWIFLVRHAFNAITINEPAFITHSIYYFLWDFTRPTLDLLSSYVPNMVANCGMLYNALKHKTEVYNVNIGTRHHEVSDFFRVNTLNNRTFFLEHSSRLRFARDKQSNIYCPIEVPDAFDNSIFSPFLKPDNQLTIIARESCRTIRLQFKDIVKHLGFTGFRYEIGDRDIRPSCLDNAMGINLPKGMFDVSKCLFNEVPAAFCSPHFFGTDYNYGVHYEGITPHADIHDTFMIIEPITGIPIQVKYRFQSTIPLPDMKGYNKDLQRFSNMILPSFWYEYELDELPMFVLFLMRLQIFVAPILQPILMVIFAIISCICLVKIYLIINDKTLKDLIVSKLYNKQKKTLDLNVKPETDL